MADTNFDQVAVVSNPVNPLQLATKQYVDAHSSAIQVATVILTAAQIKAWNATPIQVIAGPGANKVIVPLSGFIQYTAGASAFTDPGMNAGILFFYNGAGVAQLSELGSWLDSAYNLMLTTVSGVSFGYLSPITGNGIANAACVNKALMVGDIAGSEFAAGNGTLSVTIYHTVVTLS